MASLKLIIVCLASDHKDLVFVQCGRLCLQVRNILTTKESTFLLDMDPVTSLKIIVFPSLEDKIFASDRKGFYPTSSSAFNTKGTLANRQIQNGDRIDLRKLAAERKNSGNKRQFSCPSIIDFNTLKSYQEIRPMHKPKRIFNGFFPSRVRSTISVGLQGAYRDGQVSQSLKSLHNFFSVDKLLHCHAFVSILELHTPNASFST